MLLLAAVVAAASCSAAPEERATTASAPTESPVGVQEVRVTRDTARGPAACHPREVGELVVGFFAAVNHERTHGVADFFTRGLGWYSVTEWSPRTGKRHFVAYEPSKLERYFERRARRHERLHLLEIEVAYERAGNLGHVAYVVARAADDLTGFGDAVGKGAIDCATGRIAVWSMGHDKRFAEESSRICPGDPDRYRTAIACARK